MKDEFLEIRTYINNISYYDSSENREYDHYPYLKGVLENFTAKQQDDFINAIFTWYDHELYFVADCLNFTDYILKGRYESSYVFCECFAKIDNVKYLEYLYQDLELHLMHRKFFKNDLSLSLQDIINNLYLLINYLRDENSIDFCLKIIENIDN
ncbi:hypothetical protein [Chryseobacterium mulctrae]|uniref:hypothetical protein n=1 Tax=Chryseobacterium mulctrae TaxID=2576777 RepID=UPI001115B998|nr:hypothetical protein [Chryseobacterium mulctrae]